MEVVTFTVSIVISFFAAWKAVDFLEPRHSGKAAIFAILCSLLVPMLFVVFMGWTEDPSDDLYLVKASLVTSPMVTAIFSKATCALLAVFAWCGGEALLGQN
jgi:hypothetical protein